jgi:hypothetical protein
MTLSNKRTTGRQDKSMLFWGNSLHRVNSFFELFHLLLRDPLSLSFAQCGA